MVKKGNDGKLLEELALRFFTEIFQKMGYTVLMARKQNAGTQDGHDLLFKIRDGFTTRRIFMECKDYKSDVSFGHIYAKLLALESSFELDSANDIAVFLSPRANFSNPRHPEKTSAILNDGRFKVQVRLLEKSNDVEGLFSLNPDIYEQLYGVKSRETVVEADGLQRLKMLLWGLDDGPTGTDLIPETDKTIFLPDLSVTPNYIARSVQLIHDPDADGNLLRTEHRKNWEEGLLGAWDKLKVDKECPGLVLLGNPGMGKSTELSELAIRTWSIRNQTGWVPFYRNVKDFLSENQLEDLLPANWMVIPKLLILLDGLDEVEFGPIFRTRLEQFIQKYRSGYDLKIILSCRTNIYDHVIKDIARFKCFELEPLEMEVAMAYLKGAYQVPADPKRYNKLAPEARAFLTNPYYLNLMGQHFQEHKDFPRNKSILMESHIQKRIQDDAKRLRGNVPFDGATILLSAQKVALAMEAMQTKQIDVLKLGQLLGTGKEMFVNSCFMQKAMGVEVWEFEHRNLQEFFVARALSQLHIDQILELITIDGPKKKTHPSWYNSISYLINLLDATGDTYKGLVDWLCIHDPQILLGADSDRIDVPLRNTILQEYFNKRCKVQKLWLRPTSDTDMNELVRFGDTLSNVRFLLKELQYSTNHRRTRISAMDLLSKMSLLDDEENFKTIILDLLKASLEEVDIDFKHDVLLYILNLGYHKEDGYLEDILKCIGHIDHKRIISGILSLISEKKSDDYIAYIKQVTPIITEEKPRKFTTKVNLMTREKDVLKSAFSKFDVAEHLLYALEVCIEHEYAIRIEKNDITKIIERLILAYKNDHGVFAKVLAWVKRNLKENRRFLFKFEGPMARFFMATGTSWIAFENIYSSSIGLEQSRHFLCQIVGDANFPMLLEEHKKGHLEDKELFYFRNVMSGVDYDMSLKFQNLVTQEIDYDFEGKVWEGNINAQWKEYHKTKDQLSFDLMFDVEKIRGLTDEYFNYIGKDALDWENLQDHRQEFYDSLKLQQKFLPSFIDIINDARRIYNKKIERKDVHKLIGNDLYMMRSIQDKLKNRLRDKLKENLKVSQAQVGLLNGWCQENLPAADFAKAYNHTVPNNELRCELLWFFRNQFNLTYKKSVLLDMLKVDYYEEKGGLHGYGYILACIPEEEVTLRIIENLKNGLTAPHHIFSNHVHYALDRRLGEVYGIIRTYLRNGEVLNYDRLEILKKYVQVTKDVELLKEILVLVKYAERSNDISHSVLELLIEQGEKDFVIERLMEFRSISPENENEFWTIKYLFRAGHQGGVELLTGWLQIGNVYGRDERKSLSNQDMVGLPLEVVQDIPSFIRTVLTREEEYDNFTDPIRLAYELMKALYPRMEGAQILGFIGNLDTLGAALKTELGDFEVFHLNTIINEAWDAYYKAESKPVAFTRIKTKIEGLALGI